MNRKFLLLLLFGLTANSYSFSQGLLYLDGSGAAPNLTIQMGADVYVEGGFVANSGATGMALNGNLYIGKTSGSIVADWSDNMASSSVLTTSTGTVFLLSNLQQNVNGANTKFYNLYLDNTSPNTSGIQLLSNIEVSNQITFNDGEVYANSYVLLVSNSSSSAVINGPGNPSYSGSWVAAVYPNGKLDREITSSGFYDFPIGSTSVVQLLQVNSSGTFSGISRFSSSWEGSVTGNAPVVLSECGTPYNQVSTGGEWHLRPANGGSYGTGVLTSGDLSIIGWHLVTFPGLVDNKFGMVVRADGNTTTSGWSVPVPSCTSLAAINTPGRTTAGDRVTRNNVTTFSDAESQLGIGISNFVLPIELTTFTVTPSNNDAILNWTTSSEYNSDFFAIERSLDGMEFRQIATVPAAGTSLMPLDYSFVDYGVNEFAVNKIYYRLRMVDADATFDYSDVRWINSGSSLYDASMVVFPNPFTDQVSLTWNSSDNGHAVLQLTDVSGKIISQQYFDFIKGSNFVLLDRYSSLAQGIYFLHLVSGKIQRTQKLVKQ